jgi:hypothetical protein
MIKPLIALLMLARLVSASIELSEDILGTGEVQTSTTPEIAKDSARGLGQSAYARTLLLDRDNASLRSSFWLKFGQGSYMVASSGELKHFVEASKLKRLNATSAVRVGPDSSMAAYSLQGFGRLRKRVMTAGVRGHMLGLSGAYVTGESAVNNSSRYAA